MGAACRNGHFGSATTCMAVLLVQQCSYLSDEHILRVRVPLRSRDISLNTYKSELKEFLLSCGLGTFAIFINLAHMCVPTVFHFDNRPVTSCISKREIVPCDDTVQVAVRSAGTVSDQNWQKRSLRPVWVLTEMFRSSTCRSSMVYSGQVMSVLCSCSSTFGSLTQQTSHHQFNTGQ